MLPETPLAPVSKKALWAGWIMGGLPALFLLFDAVMKLMKPDFVVEGTLKIGFPESIFGLGVVLLASTVLYVIPRTAILGAILLTGYLGGAIAWHIRREVGVFPILFPMIFCAMLWGGLYLREPRLRALVPLRS